MHRVLKLLPAACCLSSYAHQPPFPEANRQHDERGEPTHGQQIDEWRDGNERQKRHYTGCPSSNDLRLLGLWKNGVSGSVCMGVASVASTFLERSSTQNDPGSISVRDNLAGSTNYRALERIQACHPTIRLIFGPSAMTVQRRRMAACAPRAWRHHFTC